MGDAVDIFTREVRASRTDAHEGVDHKAVEILERILDRVKAGEITGFAIVAGTEEDSTVTSWTRTIFDDPFMFLGRLEALKTELLMDLYQENYGPIAHHLVEEDDEE